MREERGQVRGDQVIGEPYTLWGAIAGNVTAVQGSKFYVRGTIYGDLTVLHGGRVHIHGKITGSLTVKDGAKVIVDGVIGKNAVNMGGRMYINNLAHVMGQVQTEDGETQVDPKAKVGEQ